MAGPKDRGTRNCDELDSFISDFCHFRELRIVFKCRSRFCVPEPGDDDLTRAFEAVSIHTLGHQPTLDVHTVLRGVVALIEFGRYALTTLSFSFGSPETLVLPAGACG